MNKFGNVLGMHKERPDDVLMMYGCALDVQGLILGHLKIHDVWCDFA